MKKILFVCLGNICRSPAAEGVMLSLLKERNLLNSFAVDSAGTSSFHAGEWPDERMISEAKKRHVILPTQSRPITDDDLENFDFILCMDQSNLKNVMKLKTAEANKNKIKLFCEYRKQLNFTEVPDPYYGTLKDFNLVLDIVHDAAIGFLEKENA